MKKIKLLIFINTLCTLYTPFILYSQWHQQTIPVSNPIVGLDFVDSLRGWTATSSNQDTSYILYTPNGGTNWNIQFRITGVDLEVLDAIDSSVIYAGGYRYSGPPRTVLLKSTNGGLNWVDMNMTMSNGFDDMFFVNRNNGYICENTFLDLYRTTNGGLNWERKVNGINQFPFRLFFLDYSTGYCGASSIIFKTTNAGDNWFGLADLTNTILSIFFVNEITGWAGLGLGSRINKTTNGGQTWILENVPEFGVGIPDVKFINVNTGWGGTSINYIYKTITSGLVWGYQIDSTGSSSMSFTDSLKGWTGRRGIAFTNNGGGTITHIHSYTNLIPDEYNLSQNYPNPFNGTTNISFEIKTNSIIKLKIYDISGREINKWESAGVLLRGKHEFLFDADELSSGVYFYKLEVTGENGNIVFSESKKMILIK